MKFQKIAKNNIKNSFGLYKDYFISLSLIIALFNTLQIFAKDNTITYALSDSGKVEFMSYVTSFLFTLFTAFFIIYFNHFFLKQRSEELGIYSMLGMSKHHITSILMIENIIVISFSLLFGIIISIFLYGVIKTALIVILRLKISFFSPLSISPFVITLGLVLFMSVVIFIDNYSTIKNLSILSISNLNQTGEKGTNYPKPLIAYSGIASLLIAYLLVINISKRSQSLWTKFGFTLLAIITLSLTILGTTLIIKSTLTYFIYHNINNHRQLYKPTNNVFLPESFFRLKTKSKLLIVLSLIVSAIIGLTTVSFMLINFQHASLMKTVPSAIEIDQKLSSKQVARAKKIAKKYGGKFKTVKVISMTSNKPIAIAKNVSTNSCKIISKKDYTQLLRQQANISQSNIDLSKTTAYYFTLYEIKSTRSNVKIAQNNIKLKETFLWPIFSRGVHANIAISDSIYKKLYHHNSTHTVYAINGPNLRNNKQLYKELKKLNVNFLSSYETNDYATKNNSITLLMVTFVAVLFFVFIGCILYFTILMENINVIEEFRLLNDIGYNKKQLRKIAIADNLLIFAPPVVIGLLNGLMAFAGFSFEFTNVDYIKFLGVFQLVGKPIIVTCLIFLIAYVVIFMFSYHKTKLLLNL
ncbi:ABC transporter permease [uncultured Lactobacillus sp.]|uniref:FtsX-like permease family protein n=1 Tax=uncultured Lactobacillus sp. TaxID=153152 RepID=UPI0025E71149|nr:ABC transporter permease [uncultured Lactobacillus sp.]